jgi:HEPN domain-containing protein
MVDPKAKLVRAWMVKARSDLGTARKLANGPDAYLDTAIYHCQQAAEKAIKALIGCKEFVVPWRTGTLACPSLWRTEDRQECLSSTER